jgi:hypothetical protein
MLHILNPMNEQSFNPTFYNRGGRMIFYSHVLCDLFCMFTPCVRSITWKSPQDIYTLFKNPASLWKVSDNKDICISISENGHPVNRFILNGGTPVEGALVLQGEFEVPRDFTTITCTDGFSDMDYTVTMDVWTVIKKLKTLNLNNVTIDICRFEKVFVMSADNSVFLLIQANGNVFTHTFECLSSYTDLFDAKKKSK